MSKIPKNAFVHLERDTIKARHKRAAVVQKIHQHKVLHVFTIFELQFNRMLD